MGVEWHSRLTCFYLNFGRSASAQKYFPPSIFSGVMVKFRKKRHRQINLISNKNINSTNFKYRLTCGFQLFFLHSFFFCKQISSGTRTFSSQTFLGISSERLKFWSTEIDAFELLGFEIIYVRPTGNLNNFEGGECFPSGLLKRKWKKARLIYQWKAFIHISLWPILRNAMRFFIRVLLQVHNL